MKSALPFALDLLAEGLAASASFRRCFGVDRPEQKELRESGRLWGHQDGVSGEVRWEFWLFVFGEPGELVPP